MEDYANLQTTINKINQNTQKVLLANLKAMDPFKFEHLITHLLVKMNYAKNGKAVTTKKTNDDGIDCIVDLDPLGIIKLLVQVKRFNNNVTRPWIDQFSGSLRHQGIMYGLFVSTSDFSDQAKTIAASDNIRLINGTELASLLMKYQIGVKTVTYQLRTIDHDFFNDEKPKISKPVVKEATKPAKKIAPQPKSKVLNSPSLETGLQIQADLSQEIDALSNIYDHKMDRPEEAKAKLISAGRIVTLSVTKTENLLKMKTMITILQKFRKAEEKRIAKEKAEANPKLSRKQQEIKNMIDNNFANSDFIFNFQIKKQLNRLWGHKPTYTDLRNVRQLMYQSGYASGVKYIHNRGNQRGFKKIKTNV